MLYEAKQEQERQRSLERILELLDQAIFRARHDGSDGRDWHGESTGELLENIRRELDAQFDGMRVARRAVRDLERNVR